MRDIKQITNKILEGFSIREAMMQATIKDPVTGKYADVEFEDPWNKAGYDPEFDYATLLSSGECYKYKSNISPESGWWMRDRSDGAGTRRVVWVARYDFSFGSGDVDAAEKVRPVLHISSFGNLSIGSKFVVSGYSFTVISHDYALCNSVLCSMPFRNDPKIDKIRGFEERYEYCVAIHADDYEYSDVKKYIDSWFNSEIKGKSVELVNVG